MKSFDFSPIMHRQAKLAVQPVVRQTNQLFMADNRVRTALEFDIEAIPT